MVYERSGLTKGGACEGTVGLTGRDESETQSLLAVRDEERQRSGNKSPAHVGEGEEQKRAASEGV